ncbi:MAG: response regulator [Bacteroidales bacterium]|jgi:signal transduction histidine kinase/CheY-like chemotaxis protein|nr:response regulator [Bacteroidales bacterium]
MKKQVIIAVTLCLFCLLLVGYYARSEYAVHLDTQKDLTSSYMKGILHRIYSITSEARGLSVAVKPMVSAAGLVSDPAQYTEIVSLVEDFYLRYPFVRNVSLYDRQGNVFNISMDDAGNFIKDEYGSRMTVLRSREEVVTDKEEYACVFPLFWEETLVGNMSVGLNIQSFQEYLYAPCLEKEHCRTTTVLSREQYVTFPVEAELTLSGMEDVIAGMERQERGFVVGEMKGGKHSVKVLSCYERLPYSGHFFGIVCSNDISRLTRSAWCFFLLTGFLLSGLTLLALAVLRRTFRDLRTANREKEHQITLLLRFYRNAPVGLILMHGNTLAMVNEMALSVFSEFIRPDDAGKPLDRISFPPGLLEDAGGEPDTKEWTLFTFEKFGTEMHLLKKRTNLTVDNESYVILIFSDITALEQNRKNAIRSEIAKSELLSRISADFRRPIDRIKDAIALLTQQYPQDTTISYIVSSVKSISETIANMQDFGDIEAGNITLDEIPFDIGKATKEVAECYRAETLRKNIGLQVHIPPSTIRNIVGDPERFKQILHQLLSNAVKFTDEGEVRISLESTLLEDHQALVRCSVADTGRGMNKKQLKNLFSIDAREKEGESIGLGIIIAKQLVNIMDGNILVSSPSSISVHPDKPGSQFFFTILCHVDRYHNKRLDFSSIDSYDKLGVLIITTNVHDVRHRINFLQRRSIQPDVFIYGKETNTLLINKLTIDKDRYRLVIIETNNSETGYEIATAIFEKDLTKQFIFVFVDAYEQKGNYLKAKSLQMDYYWGSREDLSGFDNIIKTHFPHLFHPADEAEENKHLRRDLRILVSENNSLSQTVANLVFKNLGYRIDFARNETELNECLAANTYDIVFVDLKFPPSDGFVVAGNLRKSGYTFPIIAMTSTLNKDNIRDISNSGMNDYVQKPLNPDTVRNVLYKWFV